MSPPSTSAKDPLFLGATKSSSHDSNNSQGGASSSGGKLSSAASSQTLKDESSSAVLSPPLIGNLNDFASSSLLRHPSLAMTKLINRSKNQPQHPLERASFASDGAAAALSPINASAGNNSTLLLPAVGEHGVNAADWVLTLPVITFIAQRHDLTGLSTAMRQAIRKTSCRVFALQAFNWLLRVVTQSSSLHDIVWSVVAALTASPPSPDGKLDGAESTDAPNNPPSQQQPSASFQLQQQQKQQLEDTAMNAFNSLLASDEDGRKVCEHPLTDIFIAGDATHPLRNSFHAVLQTVADVMMHVPAGGPLQQMMMRLWALNFQPADHPFLHRSHVFNNISQILSKSERGWDAPAASGAAAAAAGADSGKSVSATSPKKNKGSAGGSKGKGKMTVGLPTASDGAVVEEGDLREEGSSAAAVPYVRTLQDLTKTAEVKASSRQAMVASLTDNSTETFWESGDEDR